jgi:hypothetical protein
MTVSIRAVETLEPTQGLAAVDAALGRVRVRVDLTAKTIAHQQLREYVVKSLPTKVRGKP